MRVSAPMDAPIPYPKVRSATFATSHGRMQAQCSIAVLVQSPARALIGDEIHFENRSAAARAEHRQVLLPATPFNDVKSFALEPSWWRILGDDRSIGLVEPAVWG